jgi:hypothetical protein
MPPPPATVCDARFRLGVERARCLVEHQQPASQQAPQGPPLALAAAGRTRGRHRRVEALRKSRDEVCRASANRVSVVADGRANRRFSRIVP